MEHLRPNVVSSLRPGIVVELTGLSNEALNGLSGTIKHGQDEKEVAKLQESGRHKVVIVQGEETKVLSVQAKNLVQKTPVVDEALDKAVRDDIPRFRMGIMNEDTMQISGSMPLPTPIERLREAVKANTTESKKPPVECHRCGVREGKLCALNLGLGIAAAHRIRLECVDCLVLAAGEKSLPVKDVHSFANDRYMVPRDALSVLGGRGIPPPMPKPRAP